MGTKNPEKPYLSNSVEIVSNDENHMMLEYLLNGILGDFENYDFEISLPKKKGKGQNLLERINNIFQHPCIENFPEEEKRIKEIKKQIEKDLKTKNA